MVASVGELERRLSAVRRRIRAAAERAGREASSVRLVAVTKTFGPEIIRLAVEAGLGEFGESYVQELIEKRPVAPGATWHFVGRLQANKVPRLLEAADWIHGLEPGRAAGRIARAGSRAPRCLVEVDLAGGRVGASPGEAEAFVGDLVAADVPVAGLMTVAPLGADPRESFAELRALRDRLAERHPAVRELSMGMSADLEAAVEEGATMVRVGSAIFGPRPQAEEA